MAIRGFALDLDGTLLRPDDSISARDRAAVEAASAAGCAVILATARWHQLAERTARELGLTDPVIACSGAEVRRHDGRDLLDVRLPETFVTELYKLCEDQHGMIMIYEGQGVAVRSERAALRRPEMRAVHSLLAADPTPRAMLIFGDDQTRLILDELGPRWSDGVRFLNSMSASGSRILTVTGKDADKGRALHVACADLGIDPQDVVAFGDSETDVEMFKAAGAGVAMGQSSPAVRQGATWVTAPHTEDGVGIAIERLLADGTLD